MRLVFITQTLDADHPVLGHTLTLVEALAARTEEIAVLCGSVGRHSLPPNVRIRSFEARSRPGRGLAFARALAAEVIRHRPDAVFSHMVPLFLILAAPLAKLRRVRLALWYTHWSSSRSLRIATRLADVVLSADERSFPLRSSKVQGIGHAIDGRRFAPSNRSGEEDGRLRLLALGRYAPVKGYPTMLEGLRQALERGVDATLEIRGPELTPVETAHRAELERIVAGTPALHGRVTLAGPVPHEQVPALLNSFAALVSATQPTSSETFDKVLCEGGACGLPVVASNRNFADVLEGLPLDSRFPVGDAGALAGVLERLADAGPERRRVSGAELRRRVLAQHSVDSWADAVIAAGRVDPPE
jgi:glycosyltransferase involved in cell wall biosynthesis